MRASIRIAAVDDHCLFLQGLRRALSQADDIVVLREGASAADACRIAVEEAPDVLLLDLNIPGTGFAAARTIAARAPRVKIIVVTGSCEDDDVAQALALGVQGYLLKGAGAGEIVDAVRAVHAGRPYVSRELASRLIVQSIGRSTPAAGRGAARRLSERERQIIRHVTAGLTNKEIAQRLALPARTVRNHMSSILRKCGARNRLEAVMALETSPDTLDRDGRR